MINFVKHHLFEYANNLSCYSVVDMICCCKAKRVTTVSSLMLFTLHKVFHCSFVKRIMLFTTNILATKHALFSPLLASVNYVEKCAFDKL